VTRRRITVLTSVAAVAAAGLGGRPRHCRQRLRNPGTCRHPRRARAGQPAVLVLPLHDEQLLRRLLDDGRVRKLPVDDGHGGLPVDVRRGPSAPGWMHGALMPGSMMGAGTDPGRFMGQLWAKAPGPRVSVGQAGQPGRPGPGGRPRIAQAAKAITFSTATVRLVAVASPAGGPDETFRIGRPGQPPPSPSRPGPRSASRSSTPTRDTAHGLVITASQNISSPMPMMTRPARVHRLGAVVSWANPTNAGMHTATLNFTGTTPGTYHYMCPVPGHAQEGMTGTFTVSNSS